MDQFNKNVNLILLALKNGDESKQRELFDLTYNHLKIIALMYAKDKNDWEDILIEAYFKAIRYISSFDNGKSGYNWLCKIVQNVAYNFDKKTESHISISSIKLEVFTSLEADIVDAQALIYEIKQLNEEDQRLLYLKYWEDKTYREIAKIVDGKKSTIHKRILQLVEILKEKLL